jgi:hypothetical protein
MKQSNFEILQTYISLQKVILPSYFVPSVWTTRQWAHIMGVNEKEISKSIPEQFSDNQEEVL